MLCSKLQDSTPTPGATVPPQHSQLIIVATPYGCAAAGRPRTHLFIHRPRSTIERHMGLFCAVNRGAPGEWHPEHPMRLFHTASRIRCPSHPQQQACALHQAQTRSSPLPYCLSPDSPGAGTLQYTELCATHLDRSALLESRDHPFCYEGFNDPGRTYCRLSAALAIPLPRA